MPAIDRSTYLKLLATLTHGKRLPEAVYIFRPRAGDVPVGILNEIERAAAAARPSSDWNLLKLHTDQVALTFLSYPNFETDPHPALAEATKINLNTGTVVKTDYRQRPNPPILHRKETFLPQAQPLREQFAALTQAEEEAGLYREPAKIGHRVFWESLLRRKALRYDGHRLIPFETTHALAAEPLGEVAIVQRHRTAIKRYDLSKPVKLLLERGLLRKNDTFFDYGCGHGMDIEALEHLGYQATGWDPAFRPNAAKTPATVVNLGYVLNVIETSGERLTALREAFALSERLLVVATMIVGQETASHSRPYGDGFLTKTNTFQKFYAPGELETLIEESLDVDVATLGLGICVAFRDPDESEAFEASRNRRRIDWTQISTQLKFSAPAARERRSVNRYELHKELFDEFWRVLLEFGRLPEAGEFDRLGEIRRVGGGLNKALALVIAQNGAELWEHARRTRSEDTLVYLAMTNFRKRFLRREIPIRIKNDIRDFFGDLTSAQQKARELLYAAGDPDEIELACEGLTIGWQDDDALYVHRELLPSLPAVLRLYVACASIRYGDPDAADIIKLHKQSGKVTFLIYDDFAGKPLPELRTRVKVNLRTLFVQVFEHPDGDDSQLLLFKERYLAAEHPKRVAMQEFSKKVLNLGIPTTGAIGPSKEQFLKLAMAHGLNERLNRLRRHQID